MTVGNATPLLALDAVAFDTETTGLDPAHARLLEIGAVRIRAGTAVREDTFRRLVNPGKAIPPASTAIHRIDDATVADAPAFGPAWQEFLSWAGDAVLVGHSVGFDLAVVQQECLRAGLTWAQPRSLDIRVLAELSAPTLAGYDLDRLAAWLGVGVEGRHSAVGDATTAAGVFTTLVPLLREAGIRTLAEAERASHQLTHVLDSHHRAGWLAPSRMPDGSPGAGLPRPDLYPYRSRTHDIMSAPVIVDAGMTIADALAEMARRRISSLLVRFGDGGPLDPGSAGIVTERDLLRAMAQSGAPALLQPLRELASKPVACVPQDALVQRAIGRMGRLNIRHLAVTDQDGRIAGVVSARDLLRLRARDAVWLGDEIDSAEHVAALGRAWAKLPAVARALRGEAISGRDVASLVSEELRALTARAAVLAERKLTESGEGAPPCPYAVIVLGSAGRGESLLALDQDNGIIFAEGEPDSAADRWFAKFGAALADILHAVGVPYCAGGVMAKNPQWRGSVATWRARVEGWIGSSNPDGLLAVDIFFDLRGVHGDIAMAASLWRGAFDLAAGNVGFAKLLAETAGTAEPGLGLFGRLTATKGRSDLKKRGLFAIVSSARALAIRHHIEALDTPARLTALIARGGARTQLEDLLDAQATFLDFIVDQQLRDIAAGRPPSNAVALDALSPRERTRLHAAFQAVRYLDELTRELLFSD